MNFINTLIEGLSIGGIYAMIALGYTMVYGIAKMLNFAHGDIIMVGGYTLFVGLNLLGLPILGLIAACIICAVVGVIIEKCAYKPLRGASPLAVLITAIGVSYLLQSIAQMAFGSASKYVSFVNLDSVTIGNISFKIASLIALAVSAVVMVGLSIFIKKTMVGRAMIAVSEDRAAAETMGISVNKIITITFIIGSVLAAVAAILYLLKSPNIFPTFGSKPGIKAFTASVIGGIGSIPGAMIGGILLGVIESICNSIPVLSPYTDAIEFAILIIILLVRPVGLLGKKKREKV